MNKREYPREPVRHPLSDLSRTTEKTMEHDLCRCCTRLNDLHLQLGTIKDEERARIERDLHDDLGGNLIALKMMLAQLHQRLPTNNPDLMQRVTYLDSLIDRSIDSIHRIACNLRPGILDAGLVTALDMLAQECSTQTGIPFCLHHNLEDIGPDHSLAVGLFQIAQEACNNIRKHAEATCVDIHLFQRDDMLLLEVIDNGCGMDTNNRPGLNSLGLRSMKERTETMGGTLAVISRPGKGTIVSARIPFVVNHPATVHG